MRPPARAPWHAHRSSTSRACSAACAAMCWRASRRGCGEPPWSSPTLHGPCSTAKAPSTSLQRQVLLRCMQAHHCHVLRTLASASQAAHTLARSPEQRCPCCQAPERLGPETPLPCPQPPTSFPHMTHRLRQGAVVCRASVGHGAAGEALPQYLHTYTTPGAPVAGRDPAAFGALVCACHKEAHLLCVCVMFVWFVFCVLFGFLLRCGCVCVCV